MAYKQITELSPSGVNLDDAHVIEGQIEGTASSVKYTGAQVRAVEKAERELADETIADAVGLDASLNLVPFSTTNYIDAATTIAEAIELLDTALGTDSMTKAVYDPTGMNGDAFDMDNMNDGILHKVLTVGPQNITGEKTFLNQPKFSGVPALDVDLVNKAYVDSFAGDMTKAVYDPTSVEGDAFDMDNMVEGDVNMILTNAAQLIKGKKEFDSFPTTPETVPIAAYEVANKIFVESVALGIKTTTSAALGKTVASSGTMPVVSNADNVININLTSVETPTTVSLGSMAAKKFWEGTLAAYNDIVTKDSDTIYYIYE